MTGIFKAYDIRGFFEKELTLKDAFLIGFYLPKFLNLKSIKVAHDMRLSQEIITKFLIKGIKESGCNVIYLGKSSTPNFYFSLFKGVSSGIVITASHNPKEYNGFKIINEGKSFDSRSGLLDLEQLVRSDLEKIGKTFNSIKKSLAEKEFRIFLKEENIRVNSTLNSYVNFLDGVFAKILTKRDLKTLKNIEFNLDCSSGMSGLANSRFFKDKPLKVNFFNQVPDGNFSFHPPDPIKAKSFVKSIDNKAFFTAVFDGDGDRIIFYDHRKDLIFQDYTIALFIDYFSKKSKKFVCDLRVSKSVLDLSKKKGLNTSLIRVGRAFYTDFMIKNNCKFGAELSGHLFFSDFNNFDNPDIAIIYFLKILAIKLREDEKTNLIKILKPYKKYSKIEETNIKIKDPDETLKNLEDKFSRNLVSKVDGLSFNFKDYWFNIRKSNTENLVRINFEGKSKLKTENEMVKLVKEIEGN